MERPDKGTHRSIALCGIVTGLVFALGTWLLEPTLADRRAGKAVDERTEVLMGRLAEGGREAFEAALLLHRQKEAAGSLYLAEVVSRGSDETLRIRAIEAFVEAGDRAILPVLRRLRENASPRLRRRCDAALLRLDPQGRGGEGNSVAATPVSS